MPQTINILYLIDSLEGDGAERQLCELAQGVNKVDGFQPHVGILERSDSGHAWILERAGIEVKEFVRRSRFDLSPLPNLVRYIRRNNIDLVHTYLTMGGEFGLLAARICGKPIITSSIRDSMNRDWREAVRTWYQSRFSDIAVANCQAGFNSRFRRMRANFRVIHNGFDLSRFNVASSERAKILAELGLAACNKIVCMAARMEKQKDHRTLIESFANVRKSIPDAVLLLPGQGPAQQALAQHCDDLGISQNVLFLGHRRDIESILSVCHVSVLLTDTRIHKEGISNTIIESMALAKPVIATRGGGTDEIIEDDYPGLSQERIGIKVDAHSVGQVTESLIYLLENDAERIRIGENAKRSVENRFNLDRFLKENIGLYRELLAH